MFVSTAEFDLRLAFVIRFYLVARLCRREPHLPLITGGPQDSSKEQGSDWSAWVVQAVKHVPLDCFVRACIRFSFSLFLCPSPPSFSPSLLKQNKIKQDND